MQVLQRGANAPFDGREATVSIEWTVPAGRRIEADVSAYLLTAAGRVRDDRDMAFYNQPSAGGGAARLETAGPGRAAFQVSLDRVPAEIDKLVFCLTLDRAQSDGDRRGVDFAALQSAVIRVGPANAAPALTFEAPLAGAREAAMIMGELYRRQGAWKFRAVGQGFNGGLGPLARSFGIDIAADPPPSPRPPPPSPPPPPTHPPPPPPVSLSKIRLEKRGQSVSLEKKAGGYGEIRVNLNWSRASGPRARPIDLDLACLFELSDGGKGAVQALGDSFGDYDGAPWVVLSGDDRTGQVAEGETIRINGRQWAQVKRLLIYAFIYEGAANWQATDGVVLLETPGQPPIEVRLTEGRNDRRMCAIAWLENDRGAIKVTRLVEYHGGHSAMDKAYGFGLRWVAGSKD